MALIKFTSTGRDAKGAYHVSNGKKFYFNDAEKTSTKKDDNICWGAAASNLLAATGWGQTGKMKTEDDILDYFRQSFKYSNKYGAMISSGLKWFMTGKWDLTQYKNQADQPKDNKSGGFYKGVDFSRYSKTITAAPSNMSQVSALCFSARVGMSIGFYDSVFPVNRAGGHAITCWGISTNSNVSPSDPSYYTAVLISDSDDDRNVNGGARKAPDRLVMVPITWNSWAKKYQLADEYAGSYTYIDSFDCLLFKPASYVRGGTVDFAQPTGNQVVSGAVTTSQSNSVPQFTVKEDVKISFTIENDDFTDAAGGVLEIYVDGNFYSRFEIASLAPGKKQNFRNINLGKLDEGEHLVEFFLDNGHELSSFANYENLPVQVAAVKQANLAIEGADALFSEESFAISFQVANYGRSASSGKENITLRLDGVEQDSAILKKVGSGKNATYAIETDSPLPGNHFVELEIRDAAGNLIDSHEFYVAIDPANAPGWTPTFLTEDESLPAEEQPHVQFEEDRQVVISGGFQTNGDRDTYSFLTGESGKRTLNFAFYGAEGELVLESSGTQYTFGRGIHSAEIDGDFTITLDGTATGAYKLAVSPPDLELNVSTPEIFLNKTDLRLGSGGSVEIELFLGWDPGREVTITIDTLWGDDSNLALSATSFVFNSSNWFEAQKLTLSLAAGYAACDEICLEISAPGLEEQYLQISLRETAVLTTPQLLSAQETEDGLQLTWAVNTGDCDTIAVRRRKNDSDPWENCGEFDALTGSALIRNEDAADYSYSISGVAPSGESSAWSDGLRPGDDALPAHAAAPVLNGTPYVEISSRRAQISYQRASDDRGIARYELRYGRESDLSDAVTLTPRELSVTLNNLTNGDYYYSLRAIDVDGLASDWSSTGQFTVDYQAPADADDYRRTMATALVVNEFHQESIGGGDNSDLFTVNLDAGRYRLEGDFGTGKVKVSLFDSFGKRVMSSTDRKGLLTGSTKLLAAGTYFIQIDNRAPKAEESSYSFAVTGEVFQPGTPGNNLPGVAEKLAVSLSGDTASVSGEGYVGYNDPVDFYKFTAERGGVFSLLLDSPGAKAQISIGTLDAKGNFKVRKTVNTGKELTGLLLGDGEYYVRVKAISPQNGRGNTDYTFQTTWNRFDGVADNSDDTLKTARKIDTNTAWNDWVGYGDKRDFFEFELTAAGRVSLDLTGFTAGFEIGKELKIALYDSRNRKLKLDGGLSSLDILSAGNYKVGVELANPNKQQSAYTLQVLA